VLQLTGMFEAEVTRQLKARTVRREGIIDDPGQLSLVACIAESLVCWG
jgi:hypothetical protein